MELTTRQRNWLYNGWLYGLSCFVVALFLVILKYHRLPYGGSEQGIPFTWGYADYASVILLGGIGIFIIIKLAEYGMENNDERLKLIRDLRADVLKRETECKELEGRVQRLEAVCPRLADSPGPAMERTLKGGGRCGP